ncbi:hypothetical protein DFS33DRAFT_1283492 [Desarmillaria ectypa]|nr:hypothetical protein DFS33DRAFT_1283492 [Desarmillaria ectypa]
MAAVRSNASSQALMFFLEWKGLRCFLFAALFCTAHSTQAQQRRALAAGKIVSEDLLLPHVNRCKLGTFQALGNGRAERGQGLLLTSVVG